jgi:hypothetical protein
VALRTALAEASQRREEMQGELADLRAQQAALEESIRQLTKELGAAANGSASAGGIEDLARLPHCLEHVSSTARPAQRENQALEDVARYLAALQLKYSRRALWAFHTALKINDIAQLTVLAGVSGTGKSLLPRCYAEAMGLHFLQIAVEPRWDSPQDLLGFYNYVEKRYRATELARALVHMDPFNTSGLAPKPLGDHVLLVLLDEMNLARVEYYFSEFLSRLEVRPSRQQVGNETARRGSWLSIDVRGEKEQPINLFPSHNVLFAGTMNDDASTPALSDKVLDRANVMQFPAPARFAAPARTQAAPPSGFRRYGEWQSWILPAAALAGSERERAEQIIGELAKIMEDFGRPFGHRLNEAMLTYVANYPRSGDVSIRTPLADQVELRIMPKLRGLSIDEHQGEFDRLGRLLRDDLADAAFAGRLEQLVARQGTALGLFNWRGLERGAE